VAAEALTKCHSKIQRLRLKAIRQKQNLKREDKGARLFFANLVLNVSQSISNHSARIELLLILITILTSFLFDRISKKAHSASNESKYFASPTEQRHQFATNSDPVIRSDTIASS